DRRLRRHPARGAPRGAGPVRVDRRIRPAGHADLAVHRVPPPARHPARQRVRYARHISELVGGTPLVELQTVAAHVGATVLAKVEYLNPGGSVKDRIALKMIEA